MELIAFLIIGLLAGWLAGKITRGRGFGLLGNLLIGVLGALIGGLLFRVVGLVAYGLLGRLVMALAGAILLLYLLGRTQRR
ncbi:MAG TPA: GlsB/YeaQ/YmgE family stress response membrane protein [Phycisphaerae bacterium]|jgi:uncharacterized membrane protein YeaQ/YmgE (transglycosylase-associated protein family)